MPTRSKIDTNSKITYLTKLFQMFKKTNKHAIKIPKIINIHEKSHQDMTQTVIQICCVTFPLKLHQMLFELFVTLSLTRKTRAQLNTFIVYGNSVTVHEFPNVPQWSMHVVVPGF